MRMYLHIYIIVTIATKLDSKNKSLCITKENK